MKFKDSPPRLHLTFAIFLWLNLFLLVPAMFAQGAPGQIFFDDFSGPNLNPIWQTNLPDAYCGSFPSGYAEIANYLGAPNYSFETLGASSVLRMTNTMGPLQRRGWSSSTNFFASNFRYEARFNSLVQSSTSSIDGYVEIWIMNATNDNLYDIVSPFSGSFGSSYTVFFGSSIDNSYTQSPYNYSSNTWYRLVLQCLPGQNIRASLCDDAGTELVGSTFAHGAAAFGSGFKIVLSQAVGASYTPYPTDVAVDYVSLSSGLVPTINSQPQSQTVLENSNVAFNVVAEGYGPLNYQWSFNATNLVGATNASLTLTNVQAGEAGDYAVSVSNAYGAVLSSNAVLTVNPVSTCDPAPSGLVSWWPGNGNADDIIGGNNGTLVGNTSYGPGEVGQGFVLDGNGEGVQVSSSATNLGLQNFTIETWLKLANASVASYGSGGNGVIFGYSPGGYILYVQGGTGDLVFGQLGGNPINGPAITDTNWHHVAVTKTGSTVVFYLDGTASVAQTYNVTFTFTGGPGIGYRPDNADNSFYGTIDELSVYNRALGQTEVQAIYNAGSGGKCFTPVVPVVVSQPTNQTVYAGQTAGFSVTATGTPPLNYQWSFNATNLVGATNVSLTLTNVQAGEAGDYAVSVSNAYGAVLSSNAVLTVNPVSTCDPAPSGLVSWWPGNGNADDIIGGNNGTLVGSTSYGPGEVGQGFVLDGNGEGVQVSSSATNLGLQNFTIETWLKLANASVASYGSGGNGVIFGYSPGGYILYVQGGTGDLIFGQLGGNPINGPAITDTNWHHVAVTKTGSTVVFYLDGTASMAQTYNVTFTFTGGPGIGYRPDNADNSFYGTIDELSVYNRALGQTEVQAIYNAGSGGKCFAPVVLVVVSEPTNQTVYAGQTAGFSVTATGTPPLNYQWSFNATNLVGATNVSLTLTNVQAGEAGDYAVSVSNAYGAVLSSNAILTVKVAPTVIIQPTNQTVSGANTVTFSVVVYGATPFSYQWVFNGTNLISGATNSALTLTNVQFANAGLYSVEVRNSYGSVTSSNAALIVTVDHFAWAPIPSPRFLNTRFPVEVTAEDAANVIFTNFSGSVYLNSTNGAPVAPAISGNFLQGIWSGFAAASQTGSNLVLSARDGAGHFGLANPINVVNLPLLTTVSSGNTLYFLWSASLSNFVLETSPNLARGNWVPVPESPVQIGNQYLEPVTLSGTNAFYRLTFTGQ